MGCRRASVRRDWPSTVAIAVVERVPVATTALPAGGYALLDATGRVLAGPGRRGLRRSPSSRCRPSRLPGQFARGLGTSPARHRRPAPRVPPAPFAGDRRSSADGVVLHLKGGLRAVVGDDEALAQKFVSLVTVLRGVNLSGVGEHRLEGCGRPGLDPPGQRL